MAALTPNIVGSALPQGGAVPASNVVDINPLLVVRSNQQMAAADKAQAMAASNLPQISGLASWVKNRWDAAKRAKIPHELKMLQDLRQRDGQYDPDDLATIRRSGGSEIYMMLTATKCRAAQAWIKDVLLPADDKPWGIDPTPIPNLPPDVAEGIEQHAMMMFQQDMVAMIQQLGYIDPAQQQALAQQAQEAIETVQEQVKQQMIEEAKERARKMEDRIDDQLQEGGFYEALEECVDDLVTYPAAILKGPVVRRRKDLQWVQDETGRAVPQVQEVFKTEFKRVSPFDLYPLPQTSDIQTGGFFERQKLSVEDLAAMIGVPGYSDAAIRAAIDDYAKGGLREWLTNDAARATAEGRPHEYLNSVDTIEALEFWGRVPGKLLLEWGMGPEEVPDRSASYEANVWLVGHYVIRAALNPHPTGKRPYGMASYERVPGQVWGKGIPRLMRDCQRLCNAAARAIANNMAISSGPQVAIRNTRRLPLGEAIEDMYPWKIWQFLPDERGSGESPIDFFQPSSMVGELLEIYGYFSRLADDYSGVIASAYGSDNAAGAGKTASGQAMLMTNASKVLSGVIGNVDRGIVERVVDGQFIHNMLYDDDESIKGDLFVVSKGSAKLIVKEQAQLRRNEFLAATANPIDMQIVGIPGRATVLREVARTLQLDKDIVPSEEEVEAMVQQQAMAMQQQAAIEQQAAISQPPQGNKQ